MPGDDSLGQARPFHRQGRAGLGRMENDANQLAITVQVDQVSFENIM
jgi:hypothetical protein